MVAMDIDPPGTTSEPQQDDYLSKTLCIPIRSSSSLPSDKNFVEIYPEEVSSISTDQLMTLLRDESAPLSLWTEAALLYMQNKCEEQSTSILSTACSESVEQLGSQSERVRVHAATGLAYLTQANKTGTLGSLSFPGMAQNDSNRSTQREAADRNEELRVLADRHFVSATKIEPIFPMTSIGRGVLNLSVERLEQAKFFFETTLKQCGQVLPALLGMACVHFKEGNYLDSLEMYSRAMTLFPNKSGAATRVGFGLACYKLGQVDRARAAFRRAHDMDSNNVEAMVGIAVLDTANLDDQLSKDYRAKSENAIRLISMANMIDHSNAMVQNHLANHYFKKWTPISSVTAKVQKGSNIIKGSVSVNLDVGERIRIGPSFETTIVDEEDSMTFQMKDSWNAESAGEYFQNVHLFLLYSFIGVI
jgi:tetratricopeptide (TPR) repeat protein